MTKSADGRQNRVMLGDTGNDAWMAYLKTLHLADLRKKVEERSSRIKWVCKMYALEGDQQSYFTPPLHGAHIHRTDLNCYGR